MISIMSLTEYDVNEDHYSLHRQEAGNEWKSVYKMLKMRIILTEWQALEEDQKYGFEDSSACYHKEI